MSDLPSQNDTRVLRELARRVAEIAALPEQAEKAELWTRHNDLGKTRPMVLIFPEGSWSELADGWVDECEHPLARRYERDLRQRLYSWEFLRDDNVIEPTVNCPVAVRNTGHGIQAANTRPDMHKGAYHIEPVLIEEADIERIRIPEVTVGLGTDQPREGDARRDLRRHPRCASDHRLRGQHRLGAHGPVRALARYRPALHGHDRAPRLGPCGHGAAAGRQDGGNRRARSTGRADPEQPEPLQRLGRRRLHPPAPGARLRGRPGPLPRPLGHGHRPDLLRGLPPPCTRSSP